MRNDSVFSFRSQKGYVPSLVHNLVYQISFPFRMKGKDVFILAGATVITLSLIHFDQDIDKIFRPVKTDFPIVGKFSEQVTDVGDYKGYILLAGYGCYSLGFHKYRGFRASLLASQAALSAGIWIRGIKMISSRMRPSATYTDVEYNSDHWFGPFAQFDKDYNSERGIAAFDAFASGHTGCIFAMATVFSEVYKDKPAVPVIMYSTAGIIGLTRLVQHEHWASDVFLGGLIGYLCGKQVVKNENRLFPSYEIQKKKSYSFLLPEYDGGVMGLKFFAVF
jgi:membrane-associated phospholipid phosphatase